VDEDQDGACPDTPSNGSMRPSSTDMLTSLGSRSPGVAKKIRLPSGDQANVSSTIASPTRRGVPPSALTTQIACRPPRAETKATRLPSGENAWRSSIASPAVSHEAGFHPTAPARACEILRVSS
jgi:hypothetical protein